MRRALAGCTPGAAHYYFNSFVARKLAVAGMPRPAEIGAFIYLHNSLVN
jgi:hypothetical protein